MLKFNFQFEMSLLNRPFCMHTTCHCLCVFIHGICSHSQYFVVIHVPSALPYTYTYTRAQWKCFMHFNITMKFSYTVNIFVPTINTHKNPIKMEMNQNQWKCHKVFDVAWNVGSHFSLVANRIIFIAFNFHIKGNQIRTYSSYLLMH